MAATFEETKIGSEHLFLTPKVPQGLAAAVEGLTREVIRQRPENIYAFAAQHFEKLLQLREQYGLGGNAESCEERSRRIIDGLSEAIKERQKRARPSHCCSNYPGWSLNETAKVLERHRSIFGEAVGQKMSTEQVRELADKSEALGPKPPQTERKSRLGRSSLESKSTGRGGRAERAGSKNPESEESSSSGKCDSKATPRIISQIPLTKDIKTELKKHRRSSRERKKNDERRVQVSRDRRETLDESAVTRRCVEKTKSHEIIRSEQRRSSRSESISIKKTTDVVTIKDKSRSSPAQPRKSNAAPAGRTTNMDRVKNYTIQTFAGMDSIEELQSPSYVEKVQEVINETSTIIKEKVEALKTDFVKVSKTKHSKRERSSSRAEEHSKHSGKNDQNDQQSNSREALLISSSSSSSPSSSSSSRHSAKNPDLPKSTANNVKTTETMTDQAEPKAHSDNSDSSNDSKISLPAVRPTSSKSTSRSVSARSDSADGLVLPPISPESTKVAKVKEELVLPVLSPPHSSAVTPDSLNSDVGKVAQNAKIQDEEEFHDSLNVTPDLLDDRQRPDSLETPDMIDKISLPSGHASPVETLKDKLLEIEDVQKRIEGVLDDTMTGKDEGKKEAINNDTVAGSDIQDKLLEIQESEKRIEQILDSQTVTTGQTETNNVNIKNKLEELESVEKRIKSIFDVRSEECTKNGTEQTKVSMSQESKNFDSTVVQANGNGKQEASSEKSTKTTEASVQRNDDKKLTEKFEERNQATSPHSYILTEGSPYEIPDTVTTVIIPDRVSTPDSDILQSDSENEQIYSTLVKSSQELEEERRNSIHDAFGEPVDVDITEIAELHTNYVSTIKNGRDKVASRQDLDLIKEEHDKEIDEAAVIDSEDERVLKVVTSSLEDILDKPVEYVSKKDIEIEIKNVQADVAEESLPKTADTVHLTSVDEVKDIMEKPGETADSNSSIVEDTTAKLSESSDDIKETSIASDRSSSLMDFSMPVVPELNLDSLPDATLSSLDEQKDIKKEEKQSAESDPKTKSASIEETLVTHEKIKQEEKITAEKSVSDRISQETQEKQTVETIVKEETLVTHVHDKETSDTLKKSESLEESRKDIVIEFKDEAVESQEKRSAQAESTIITQDSGKTDVTSSENVKGSTDKQATIVQDDKLTQVRRSSADQAQSGSKESDSTVINVANNFISREIKENIKELANEQQPALPHENKLLLSDDAAESLKGELENKTSTDRPDHPGIEANDQTRQLPGDSTSVVSAPCQRTTTAGKQPDSNDPSIKTNSEESPPRNDPSHQTVTKQDADKESEKHEEQVEKPKGSETFRLDDDQLPEASSEKEREQSGKLESSDEKSSKSSTESNFAFLMAVLKIQAGFRGYLARRRLRVSQCRSSTLDSVPSILDSFIVGESSETVEAKASETAPNSARSTSSAMSNLLSVVGIATSVSELKKRKRLRREDALRSTTLSLDKAFAENQIQHTGEFHDCIPLPVFDLKLKASASQSKSTTEAKSNATGDKTHDVSRDKRSSSDASEAKQTRNNDKPNVIPQPVDASNVEHLLNKILLGHAATSAGFANQTKLGQFVDVVLLPNDPEMLQSGYLNFITSVEDVSNDLFADTLIPPDTPKGVIIEEITSLDEEKIRQLERKRDSQTASRQSSDEKIEPSDSIINTASSRSQESDIKNERSRQTSLTESPASEKVGETPSGPKVKSDADDLSILETASGQFPESSMSTIDDHLLMDIDQDSVTAGGSENVKATNEALTRATVSHSLDKLDDVTAKSSSNDRAGQDLKAALPASPKGISDTADNLAAGNTNNSNDDKNNKAEQKPEK